VGIQKREFYIVKCDICGEELQNGDGGILCLDSRENANEHIPLGDWNKKNGKIACENCYEKL
jgi:formylmethanofuran dehydrogenase subunit E